MAKYKVIDPETDDVIGEVVSDVIVYWDASPEDAKELKLVRVEPELKTPHDFRIYYKQAGKWLDWIATGYERQGEHYYFYEDPLQTVVNHIELVDWVERIEER